jgi:hypothetical protein
MAVRNYVFRELEHANYLCVTGNCTEISCYNKPAVHEVDEAVAFWVGSLEGKNGGTGVLSYDMTNNRGAEFGTASNGIANANAGMFQSFEVASQSIKSNDCDGGKNATLSLWKANTIPLVQNLLKYTRITADGGGNAVQIAERVAAAMNVLPLISSCSPSDADVIYENVKVGASTTSYDAVAAAVANNYQCLGISAENIGTTPTTDDSADEASSESGTNAGESGGTIALSAASQSFWMGAAAASFAVGIVTVSFV